MTAREVMITGAGSLLWCGEGVAGVRAGLEGEGTFPVESLLPGLEMPVGRVGKLRAHPLSKRYDRFGQIDTWSRYAFVAAGLALEQAGIEAGGGDAEVTGVACGTAWGCVEANQLFDQFTVDPTTGLRGASPLHFKGTLSNAPAGWCAVGYGLKGPTTTYVSGPVAGMEALHMAHQTVASGRAPRMLAGGTDRLLPVHLLLGESPPPGVPGWAEGAAMVLLEAEEEALARGALPLMRLLGTARGTAREGLLPVKALLAARGKTLSDLLLVLPGPGCGDRDPLLVALGEAMGGETSSRIHRPEALLGDPLAAWGALAVHALLVHPVFPAAREPALIHHRGENGEHHFALVAPG